MSFASGQQQKLPRKEERRRQRKSAKDAKRILKNNKTKIKNERRAKKIANANEYLKPFYKIKGMYEDLPKKTKGYARMASMWGAIIVLVVIVATYGGIELPSRTPKF